MNYLSISQDKDGDGIHLNKFISPSNGFKRLLTEVGTVNVYFTHIELISSGYNFTI
jgi:hypothetical protein